MIFHGKKYYENKLLISINDLKGAAVVVHIDRIVDHHC
jgi:hypothetical protein